MRKPHEAEAEYLPPAPVLSICPHPLKAAAVTKIAPAGMTVAEILYHFGYGYVLLPSCRANLVIERLDGTVVELSKAQAFEFRPLPGDIIGVRVLPGKGGGKNPLSTIISIAAMVATPFVASALVPMFAVSGGGAMFGLSLSMVTQFAAGGLMMLASGLVNSFLVSPPTSDISNTGGGTTAEATSTTYSIAGSQNKMNKWGVVPQLLGGTFRIYPCHGAEPYTEVRGEDTYLRQLFTMYGPVKVEDMRIGETPLTDFTDYEIEVREGWASDAPVTLYSNGKDVHQESLSLALPASAGWVSRRSNPDADELIFDVAFARFYRVNQSTGKYEELTVDFEVEISLAGAADWKPWNDAATNALSISGKFTSAYTKSFHMAVKHGQYDVRWRRITADDTTNYSFDAMTIATLRTITSRDPISTTSDLPPLCKIALVIKGSGQLNGIINQFNFLGTAYLPVWNEATAAFEMKTSNVPAWAYVNVLRGPANKKPTPDALIDTQAMLDWAAWTEAKGLHINAMVDTETTVREILLKIARVGRASSGKRDNLYSVVVDNEKTTYDQVLSPRNSWGFEGKVQLPDITHGVRCVFNNKEKNYVQDERPVYAPGYDEFTASEFEELQLWGVDNAAEAWMSGQFHMANVRLRPEQFNAWMDWESLRCRRGSLIKCVHDVPMLGNGQGRIKALEYKDAEANPPDMRVTAITIDSKVTMEAGKVYAAAVRLYTGALMTTAVVTEPGDVSRLVMPGTEPILASAAPAVGDLLIFSEAERLGEDFVVTNIERGDDYTARLTLRHYAPGVQTADSGTIPAFNSNITRTVPTAQAAPGVPVIDAAASDESAMLRLADGTYVPGIAVSVHPGDGLAQTSAYQVRVREVGGAWGQPFSIGGDARTIHVDNVAEGNAYDVHIRAVSAEGIASAWVELLGLSVVGNTTPPPTPQGLTVQTTRTGLSATWTAAPAPWVSGYDIELDGAIVESGYAGDSKPLPAQTEGVHAVRVRSRDASGLLSPWVGAEVVVVAPSAPLVTASISGGNIRLAWEHRLGSFALASSEILHGDTLETSTPLGSGLSDTSTQVPGAAGAHRFWVRDTDVVGNTGPAGMVETVISAPGAVAITPQVIDNNVLLAWTENAGTLPVADCELRRGATYATSTLIGRISGRFATIFESVAGTYTYWITQRDIAGNDGTPASITVQVSQPPDYVLHADTASTFGGTLANALLDGGALLLPVDTTSTVAAKMTVGGWASRQAKADAGFPYRLEPTPAVASYQEVIDHGTILAGTKITVTQTSQAIHGSVALSCNLKVRASEADAWTDLGDVWGAYGTAFRYLQVTITATPDGGSNDLLRLTELRVRLDVKLKSDAGSAICDASDSGGTQVDFNVSFVDVQSITLTPAAGGAARYALYNFSDVVNPTGFKILLYDASGNRVSGTCSWSSKGV